MLYRKDPPRMPDTGETPAERLTRTLPLAGTPAQAYVEKRGIPLPVAVSAGLRFDPDFGGRAAVVAALTDRDRAMTALHGRYLRTLRGQNKMLTFGAAGGVIGVLDGWRADPLILVEGLFDALSLAACDIACIATIGRWAPWLPETTSGRTAWLAFDTGRPGETAAARLAARLPSAQVRRLPPPPRCKDWNTALVKRGGEHLKDWIERVLHAPGTPPS